MAQDYDVSLKLLFHHSRGRVAQRLFGARVVEWLNVEQPKVNNLRVDMLARMDDGTLRHVEFASKNDPDMGFRELEYSVGFRRLLGEDVDQVVLYAGREPLRMKPVYRSESTVHRFKILDIRRFDGEPFGA